MARKGTTGAGWIGRAALILLTAFFLSLLIGSVASLMGPDVLAQGPQTINTPLPAPTGVWPTPGGNILSGGSVSASVQTAVASPTTTAGPLLAPTATGASGQDVNLNLPQPAFEVAPEVGLPGSQIVVAGQGWPPDDTIVLRLQDPANPYMQPAEFVAANADSSGSFRVNFTLPSGEPWDRMPAIVIWAVSQTTGLQAAQPEPFVFLSGPLQPPPLVASATPAPTESAPTATASPTATATATPVPVSAYQSPVETPAPVVLTATALPTATFVPTPVAAFQSPLPTLTATLPAPGILPVAGAPVLSSATLGAQGAVLRTDPGAQYSVLRGVPAGASVGVMGQDASGSWLLVTTVSGASGWVERGQTDFAGRVPVVTAAP